MVVYFLNTETNEYPIYEGDLRRRFPNASLAKPLVSPPMPYVGVHEVEQPEPDLKTERVVESSPLQVDGVWKRQWQIESLTDLEQQARKDNAASIVRNERNTYLSKSDWTQVADAPVNKTVWATYRQALRDITSQPGFPWTIEWPEQP